MALTKTWCRLVGSTALWHDRHRNMTTDLRTICFWAISVPAMIFLASCANTQTAGRTTELPSERGKGIAIHLEAQQRLILSNGKGHYCAEPSPDALSAHAASIALGTTSPSGGGQIDVEQISKPTGIGLRTQSITLMRDALYRICEASNNGNLQKWETAAILLRSQDLTAVMLAVEQLTEVASELEPKETYQTSAETNTDKSSPYPISSLAQTKGENTKASGGNEESAVDRPVKEITHPAEEIAEHVRKMVNEVVRKSYVPEMCLSYMALGSAAEGERASAAEGERVQILIELCRDHLKEFLKATLTN